MLFASFAGIFDLVLELDPASAPPSVPMARFFLEPEEAGFEVRAEQTERLPFKGFFFIFCHILLWRFILALLPRFFMSST